MFQWFCRMLRLIALQADPNVTDFQGQSGGVQLLFYFYLYMMIYVPPSSMYISTLQNEI